MKLKVKEEFGQVDFTTDDIDAYFSMFPDVNAMKGKTQLPEVHSKSNLGDMDANQVLLSCDVMHIGSQAYLVSIMSSPRENNRISNVFSEAIASEDAKDVAAATISVGGHVEHVLGFDIKIEFDNNKGVKVAKEIIEEALKCRLEMVSNHVDYAEAAIKFIKQRVRVKNSSLVYDLNSTILLHIVVGAVLIINRTSRKANGNRSAYKVLHPTKKTNFKALYSLSPTDLVEVKTHTSNSTLSLRTTTAIPLHPSISDNEDWDFYSLETGSLFTRNYKLARKIPWTHEARMRMKRLASLDPVSRDDECNIVATSNVPVHRFEMPKRSRSIHRKRRHQMRREENDAEPENEHVPLVNLVTSFINDSEESCFDYVEGISFHNDEHIVRWCPPTNVGVYPIEETIELSCPI